MLTMTRFNGGCGWAVVGAPNGIFVDGNPQITPRSAGPSLSVTRLWEDFGPHFITGARNFGVGVDTLVALAAVEAAVLPGYHRDPKSLRFEPGYISDAATPNKVSAGLMQTLLSTAKGACRLTDISSDRISRTYLFQPRNSILCAAAYIRMGWYQHHGDPVLIQAYYNAGGLYKSNANKWKLRTYGVDRTDKFIMYYNDFHGAVAAGIIEVSEVSILSHN